MTEQAPNPAHALEDTIRRACDQITTHWPNTLTLPTAGSVARRTPGRGILAPDHSPTNTDTDRATVLVSARRHTMDVLNSWCRVVMDDRNLTHGLPAGTDVAGMSALIIRWAGWISHQDFAPICADEITERANELRGLAQPRRKDWVTLGDCPIEYEVGIPAVEDGVEIQATVMRACGGTVRAWPSPTVDADTRRSELAQLREERLPRCRRCGAEATVAWWTERMNGPTRPFTAADLRKELHKRLGIPVAETTIRQWVSRGVIVACGTDDGRSVYDLHDVMIRLTMREKMGA